MLIAGTYELVVDPKNRVSVPAGIRSKLEAEGQGTTFYLAPGEFRGSLRLFPERYFEADFERRDAELGTCDEKAIYKALYLAKATLVEIDKQGRIVLPQRMLDGAKIGKQIVLSGNGDHLILWDRRKYDEFDGENAQRMNDLVKIARAAKQAAVTTSHGS